VPAAWLAGSLLLIACDAVIMSMMHRSDITAVAQH